MTIIPTLDFGAPIYVTPAEMRRAYRAAGEPVPDNVDDMDPARGIIRAVMASMTAFLLVAWVLS